MTESTNPTDKQKIEMYERFLHAINLSLIACDNERIKELITNADRWSHAHRVGNGLLSDKKQRKVINYNFWNLLK